MPGMRFKKDYLYSCMCCWRAAGYNDKRTRVREKRDVLRQIKEETANER